MTRSGALRSLWLIPLSFIPGLVLGGGGSDLDQEKVSELP